MVESGVVIRFDEDEQRELLARLTQTYSSTVARLYPNRTKDRSERIIKVQVTLEAMSFVLMYLMDGNATMEEWMQ